MSVNSNGGARANGAKCRTPGAHQAKCAADARRSARGRPATYDPCYCELVIELGEQGASLTEMARELGVHRATIYRWTKSYPDFCDAVTRAREASQAWWERQGREGLWAGAGFNQRAFIFMMRNMFPNDYRRKDCATSVGAQRTVVTVTPDDHSP